jgi:rhomboid protease GluP
MDQDNSVEHQEEQKQKRSPLQAFIPKGDYFFTPIILGINILVFVLMVISGVSPVLPNADALIGWGANYRPLTMGGEPWRLFTSMFLHFGIIHLATNMYAFYSLGRMLEPFIGKWRFILLYLFAGLGGSAVSLWWHSNDASVSAGASGAIFGLFGVFAALLTTDLIDQTIRGQLLKSMGSAILLNLLIGLYAGIDNAAHTGGLLTGAVGGYLCYFDLRDWYRRHIKKFRGVIATGILTAIAILVFWKVTPAASVPTRNEALFDHFRQEEKRSLDFIDKMDSTTTADEIEKNAVQPWQHNVKIVDSIKANGLNEDGEKYFNQLKIYTLLRLKGADEYKRAAAEHNKALIDSAKNSMAQADNVIVDLNDDIKK